MSTRTRSIPLVRGEAWNSWSVSISKDNDPAVPLCDPQWSGWTVVDYWRRSSAMGEKL